jgi:DNA-binding SARP family transcriptional activator/tetratricopeptide (TPR) repeat protein
MQFRILGPLEVVHQGSRVRIEGAKQCMALAVLLLEAGHAVPLHRFIDALWDGRAPNTARRQVQNTVAGLRRSLTEYGPDPIERIRESYRINAVELDWADFKRDTARARALAKAGAFGDAADLLVESLGRWRGPALADLNGDRIQAFALHLNETRSVAVESLIDAELEIGRHASAADRARELLASHPNRQQTVRRLMRGLHDGGHTAEALAVFDGFRTRLAEDLGLDPDGALNELHQRILRAEVPSPVHPPQPPARPALKRRDEADSAPPVPAQLPADTSVFVGRETQLAQLDSLLEPGAPSMAAVTGAGGCGKTALAVHWGYRRRDRFPDGQLYLNLRGYDTGAPLEPIDAIRSILRALDCPGPQIPDSLPDAAALYRSLVCERKLLVVLDNARSAAQVRPLIPGGSGTVTIVTSRDRMQGLIALHGAKPIRVGPLSDREAAALLTAIVEDTLLTSDPQALQRISEFCGRHPLALRIAGANLAGGAYESAAGFADNLAKSADRLELLSLAGDPEAGVSAIFDRSVQALDGDAFSMMCRLGAIPGEDYAADLVDAIGADLGSRAKSAVSRLVEGHLLERHRQDRYRFHDLMRLYLEPLQSAALGDEERAEIIERFIDWHYRERRVDEFANLVDACRLLAEHPSVWRLVLALRPQLRRGYHLERLGGIADRALQSSERNGDLTGVLQMRAFLCSLESMRADMPAARRHGEAAMSMVQALGQGDELGEVSNAYGIALFHAGLIREAEPFVEKAAEVAQANGLERNIVSRISNLGAIHRRLGRYREAETYFTRAIAIADVTGEITIARVGLGLAHIETGRLHAAAPVLENALNEADGLPYPLYRSTCLFARGELHFNRGNLLQAHDDLVESAELAAEYGLRNEEFEARGRLSTFLARQGEYELGRRQIETVLARIDESRDAAMAARAWMAATETLANCDPIAAIRYGERARQDFEQRRIPWEHGRTLLAMAEAHQELGHRDKAGNLASRALTVLESIGVTDSSRAEQLIRRLHVN